VEVAMRRTILSIILTIVFAGVAQADKLQEPFDRTLDVRAGTPVSIDNVNGRIVVTTWDQPRVRIHAIRKAESREALDKLTIDIRQNGEGVSIATHMPKKNDSGFLDFLFGNDGNASIDYDVTIPRTTDLKVENTNGGISASDVNGSIQLSTTNGRIDAIRCSGTMNAGTTNGSIHAELVQIASGKPMKFETTNGSISLLVPTTFAANVQAETTNGSIRTDLPVTTKSFSRRELHGTLNGGGAELGLYTTNGSIEVRSSGVTR
jgi:hypothetical protein